MLSFSEISTLENFLCLTMHFRNSSQFLLLLSCKILSQHFYSLIQCLRHMYTYKIAGRSHPWKQKCWERHWDENSTTTQLMWNNSTWWERLKDFPPLYHRNLPGGQCLYQRALKQIVLVLPQSIAPWHHISVFGKHSSSHEEHPNCITFSSNRKKASFARNSTNTAWFLFWLPSQSMICNPSRTLTVMETLPASLKWRGDGSKAHSMPYKYWWINCRTEGVKENAWSELFFKDLDEYPDGYS